MKGLGFSLVEVTVSVAVLVSVLIGLLSVVFSVYKYKKEHTLKYFNELVKMRSQIELEYRKLSLSGASVIGAAGNYSKIGDVSLDSNFVVYRGCADLNEDGADPTDPVWFFIEYKHQD